MQFVTVTIAGVAPRTYGGIGAPPGPTEIQAAIAGILKSDGIAVQSLTVQAAETGLVDFASSGGNPYTATITAVVADGTDPQAIADTLGFEVGTALGQPVSTVGAPIVAAGPTAPTAPAAPSSWLQSIAAGFQTDVQVVIVGLVVLGAIAIVLLVPDVKRTLAGAA